MPLSKALPMPILSLLVISPPGNPDASLAIAAYRAGSCVFLDLEFAKSGPAVQEQLERWQRFATRLFGVKIGRSSDAVVALLTGPSASGLGWVLLGGGDHPALPEW